MTDTERQTRESERGRHRTWGRGTHSLFSEERGLRDLHKAGCFSLRLPENKVIPASRPSQFWDPSLTSMVKKQEEGMKRKRAGGEKRGR